MTCHQLTSRVYDIEKRVSNVGIYRVHQMYAESNVTSCIYHKIKLGICTLTNPSVGDVIILSIYKKVDDITHTWIDQCANSKLVTDTGSHVTLRIHLMYSMPTFDTLSLYIIYSCLYVQWEHLDH